MAVLPVVYYAALWISSPLCRGPTSCSSPAMVLSSLWLVCRRQPRTQVGKLLPERLSTRPEGKMRIAAPSHADGRVVARVTCMYVHGEIPLPPGVQVPWPSSGCHKHNLPSFRVRMKSRSKSRTTRLRHSTGNWTNSASTKVKISRESVHQAHNPHEHP